MNFNKKKVLLILTILLVLILIPTSFAIDLNDSNQDIAYNNDNIHKNINNDTNVIGEDNHTGDEGFIQFDNDYITVKEGQKANITGTLYYYDDYPDYDDALEVGYSYIDGNGVNRTGSTYIYYSVLNLDISSLEGLSARSEPYAITFTSDSSKYGYDAFIEDSEGLAPSTVYINVTDDSIASNVNITIPDMSVTDTIYVSKIGYDGNDGAIDAPYATITKALDRNKELGGNCLIIINEGTYELNGYYIKDNVILAGRGNVVIYSNGSNYHILLGNNITKLYNITFINGSGQTSGAISSTTTSGGSGNKDKYLLISNCTFLNNKGPTGAVVTYANTIIEHCTFLNNTGTSSYSNMQGIISARDNKIIIKYCIFDNNTVKAGTPIVYSDVSGSVNYNFWGNNTKPNTSFYSDRLGLTNWVVLIPSINSNVNQYTKEDLTLEFKLTSNGTGFETLNQSMPNYKINLTSKLGTLNPNSTTVVNNSATITYVGLNTGFDNVSVMYDDEITNVQFHVNGPTVDRIYVSKDGDDSNDGSYEHPFKTIKAAVLKNEELGGGKTIIIFNGTYEENDIVINKIVTITGENVIISGSNRSRIFVIKADTNISNIKFIDGKTSDNGGIILLDSSKLTLNNTEFTNGNALNGGSIASVDGILIIGNSKFTDNVAENTGSVIYTNSPLILVDSTISNNGKDAIFTNGSANITNNIFSNNEAYDINIAESSTTYLRNNTMTGDTCNINLNGGIINGVKVSYLGNSTVNGRNATPTEVFATVTDDMLNPINGGYLSYYVNDVNNELINDSVINGTSRFSLRFDEGSYLIHGNEIIYSGSNTDNPIIDLKSGFLKIRGAINRWFINDTGYETLQEAVNASGFNDTIKGIPGTYVVDEVMIGHRYMPSEPYSINKTITITSLNETPITLVGNGDRIIDIDYKCDVTFKNIIFTNGTYNSGWAGAIYTMGHGNLTVINCTFINNKAEQGGAINGWGNHYIYNTSFINNSASSIGGAYFKDGEGDLILENVSFLNNTAVSYGGALYILGYSGYDYTFNNVLFDNNQGLRVGAVFSSSGSNRYFNNVRFTNNRAVDYLNISSMGGAYYTTGSNSTFNDCVFKNNTASYGGALELDPLMYYITSVVNNEVITETYISYVNLNNCTIEDNHGRVSGGAIYMGQSNVPHVNIAKCRIINNTADLNAAAIANDYGFLNIVETLFENNTAKNDYLITGLGTYNYPDTFYSNTTIVNSTFKNNNVKNLIYLSNEYSNITVINSNFINESTILYNDNGSAILINNTANTSNYSIINIGLLSLDKNNFTEAIFNKNYINTQTYVVVLNNQTKIGFINENNTLDGIILDDNNNTIILDENAFRFNVKLILLSGVNFPMNRISNGSTSQNLINGTLNNTTYYGNFIPTVGGNYLVSANLLNSGLLKLSIKTGILKIINKDLNLTVNNITKFYKGPEGLSAKLVYSDGNPVVNAGLRITINGTEYNLTTDYNGIVYLPIELDSGAYNVITTYNGSDLYNPIIVHSIIVVKSTLEVKDVVKVYKNDTQYYALYLDSEGNPLANINVNITVCGKTYLKQTNDQGIAKLNINLLPREYTITTVNPITGEEKTTMISVISPIIENKNIVMYYKNGTKFSVRVLGNDGNVVAGAAVNFTVCGKTYTKISDSEGIASLNINLAPKTYTITTTYGDYKVSNKITVLPRITAQNLNMKYKDGSKYAVKVVDNHGNPLAGQRVKITVSKKSYYKTTDNNGMAYLNINLKPGKYSIVSEFGEHKVTSKITISK